MATYRYTHCHDGILALAPVFEARNDEDAKGYIRSIKCVAAGEQIPLCGCGGEKLERRIEVRQTEKIVVMGGQWTDVPLG